MSTQEAVVAESANSARQDYLFKTLHLDHDPFPLTIPSAERELKEKPDGDDPHFFSYFVDLPDFNDLQSLRSKLSRNENFIIYGLAGHGKTTLRFHTEAIIRHSTDPILVVSLDANPQKLKNDKTSQSALNEALATDFFIQLIERFSDPLAAIPAELQEDLKSFWHTYIPNFGRTLRILLRDPSLSRFTGMAAWWPRRFERFVVRNIPLTTERERFLLWVSKSLPPRREVVPSLCQLLETITQSGFQTIYWLIDTASSGDAQNDLKRVKIIESWLTNLQTLPTNIIPFSLKLFLPAEFQKTSPNFIHQLEENLLQNSTQSAIIKWNESLLQQLIKERFLSARSHIKSLNQIAGHEFGVQLEQAVIQSANNSPRHLVRLISLLLDIHANKACQERWLTHEDWLLLRQAWSATSLHHLLTLDSGSQEKIMPGIYQKNEYAESKFTGRDNELEQVKKWLNQSSSGKQLFTVLGFPWIGKSWFIGHICKKFIHEPNFIWLDLDTISNLPDSKVKLDNSRLDNDLNEAALNQITRYFIESLTPHFPRILPHDSYTARERMLENAAGAISQQLKSSFFYIIIDGTDLLLQDAWRFYEREIIEPLARSDNIRFIIALREDHRLHVYKLKTRQESLNLRPFTEKERNNLRIEQSIIESTPWYTWEHPGLNGVLTQFIQDNNPVHDDCIYWQKALQIALRSMHQLDDSQVVGYLRKVAYHAPDRWDESIHSELSISRSDFSDWFKQLSKYQLIESFPGSSSLSQIVPGIRELARVAHCPPEADEN